MRTYRRLQQAIAALLVLYAALGVLTWRGIMPEVFPVYSWDLFSTIPSPVERDLGLRITSVGGQPLNPPVYVQQLSTVFPRAATIDAFVTIQSLGAAARDHNDTEVEKLRGYLEPTFLGGAGAVEYEVIERRFDPLRRWQTGELLDEKTLASFRFPGR